MLKGSFLPELQLHPINPNCDLIACILNGSLVILLVVLYYECATRHLLALRDLHHALVRTLPAKNHLGVLDRDVLIQTS